MKLGVIGCGKMGAALVEGIVSAGVCSGPDVVLFDVFAEASRGLSEKTGARVVSSNGEVAGASDVVLVCVKPQVMQETLAELGDTSDCLLISIAAGVTIAAIEEAVENRHRVIRVMPNTPALVGKGASTYARGHSATEADGRLAEQLLGAVGIVCEVAESDLDAVTALSGSGPAYVFLLIESLIASATNLGLDEEMARALAVQTVIGAGEMVRQTGEEPAVLRENVTSPNGTTFAALESFRSDGFREIVDRALRAARDRSVELGRS